MKLADHSMGTSAMKNISGPNPPMVIDVPMSITLIRRQHPKGDKSGSNMEW